MFRQLNKIKAQSTVEYAILIIIIIGALLSIQVYIKRGVQGRLKSAADDIGDQFSVGNTNYQKVTVTGAKTQELFGLDSDGQTKQGVSSSILLNQEVTRVTENMAIMNIQQEFWGKKQTP